MLREDRRSCSYTHASWRPHGLPELAQAPGAQDRLLSDLIWLRTCIYVHIRQPIPLLSTKWRQPRLFRVRFCRPFRIAECPWTPGGILVLCSFAGHIHPDVTACT